MQVNILKADRSVESMMRDVLNKGGVVPHELSCHAHNVGERRAGEEREIDLTNLQVFVVFWQGGVLCLDVILFDLFLPLRVHLNFWGQ